MTITDRAEQRDRFSVARAVADAVLYEGYVLYPYRASARKNQMRWQFGVLTPLSYALAEGSEHSAMRTEAIVDPGPDAVLTVRIRCLQVQHRAIEALGPEGAFVPVDGLAVDGVRWVAWDEAVDHEVDLEPVHLLPLGDRLAEVAVELPAGDEIELLHSAAGTLVGRAVRRRERVDGRVRVGSQWADGLGALLKVTVEVENTTAWPEPAERDAAEPPDRDAAMSRSLVAVHTLLAVDDGVFVSLLDPPAYAATAVEGCLNEGTFPVLVGPGIGGTAIGTTAIGTTANAGDLVLSSPIILYDHPAVAPESEGDFCDATEIDEILALRVLTLTDDEKAEARGTDRRSAAIIDRCDEMTPEAWERLHGTVRALRPAPDEEPEPLPWWDPGVDGDVDPATATVWIGGVEVGKGTPVRLRPSRRADAHDLFLAGLDATVAGIFHDVDGADHVAVTLDDDPASEMFEWQRRYLYFHPDEIEVLSRHDSHHDGASDR